MGVSSARPPRYQYPIGLDTRLVATNVAPTTTGGTQTVDGTNAVHTFSSSGEFKPSAAMDVEWLVVAGGGSGGQYIAGGGGAGGVRYGSGQPLSAGTFPVTVGAGGAAKTAPGNSGGNDGANSTVAFPSAKHVTGGGGGGGHSSSQNTGRNGGSGGGGSHNAQAGGSGNAGSYSPAEGSAGGAGSPPPTGHGGGG